MIFYQWDSHIIGSIINLIILGESNVQYFQLDNSDEIMIFKTIQFYSAHLKKGLKFSMYIRLKIPTSSTAMQILMAYLSNTLRYYSLKKNSEFNYVHSIKYYFLSNCLIIHQEFSIRLLQLTYLIFLVICLQASLINFQILIIN